MGLNKNIEFDKNRCLKFEDCNNKTLLKKSLL